MQDPTSPTSAVSSDASSLRVAFQGEKGAYSEQAVYELLGRTGIVSVPFNSFDDAFAAASQGLVELLLVPIENSLGGTIHANCDLQLQHNLFVIAEHDLRVRHCLMALPGTQKKDLKKIVSHPQALAQCDSYIKRMGVPSEAGYDTAGSAKNIAEQKQEGVAAICSSLAADHYGLDILERGIEDDDNNFTRFLLLRKEPVRIAPGVSSKTSIVFSLDDHAGALFKALSCFALRNIDLSKIESRPCKPDIMDRLERLFFSMGGCLQPSKHQQFDPPARREKAVATSRFRYLFYVDFLAPLEDPNTANAIRHLQEMTAFFRVLGCYPRGGTLVGLENLGFGTSLPATVKLSATAGSPPKQRIGILGFGNFGQFLARKFALTYDVYATSRTDQSGLANSLGVVWCDSLDAMLQQRVDILVVSVSILSFESVLRRLNKSLQAVGLDSGSGRLLVVDVLSVKVHAKTSMQALLPDSCDILCSHPMFGPQSGKHGWNGLPFVFERVRTHDARRCEEHLKWWRDQGCRMVDMTCELHDELAAGSQFVTHFTGRALAQLGMQTTPINTKGFDALLQLVDSTCKDSFDLFYALYKFNPSSEKQLAALEDAVSEVGRQLRSRRPDGPAGTESSLAPSSAAAGSSAAEAK